MAEYVIERWQQDHRKQKPWIVRKDGELMKYSERDSHPRIFKKRKDAEAHAAADKANEEWRARILTQDQAGVCEWDEAEEAEIEKYVTKLRENPLQWTMNGQHPFVTIARIQHDKDAETLTQSNWTDCEFYHAQKRRVMAARVEAFKRAGEAL